MKKIIILIMLLIAILLVLGTTQSMLMRPFDMCRQLGLNPEIEAEFQSLIDDSTQENREKLNQYYRMGEDCCELTINVGGCKDYFEQGRIARENTRKREKTEKNIALIITAMLIILSLVYLIFIQRKTKNKTLKRIFRVLAILILVISILALLVLLLVRKIVAY